MYRHCKDEKEIALLTRPNNLTQCEIYLVNVIIKIKFRVQKYSQGFSRFGTDYKGLTKFILLDRNVSVF